MMRAKLYLWSFIALLLISQIASAKDLGVIGAVYPITEPDLLQVMQQKVTDMQQNGTLNTQQTKLNQTVQQQMDRPTPVTGLVRTLQARSFVFDPSVTVPFDVKDANGKVLFPAGSRINPLETVAFSETLLFYNADDSDQVKWAADMDSDLKGNDKLILVQGSVFGQMQQFHKRVFFDQQGRLSHRLGLKQVPAIVKQRGDSLQVEEVVP